MKKTSLIVVSVIILLVVSGGAFYGGMVYGKSQNARSGILSTNFQATRANRTGGPNGNPGINFISGNIISKDSNSITLQLPNGGGSRIIFYSDTTQISKMATGISDDLITGTSVSVNGTTNSDGSVTAQSIQVRPAGQNRVNP